MSTQATQRQYSAYEKPDGGGEWYGFGHSLVKRTQSLNWCTACGSEMPAGSAAHTWAMPIMVDAYPHLATGDWMVDEATREYAPSLTRCYECLHCYVAARTAGVNVSRLGQ